MDLRERILVETGLGNPLVLIHVSILLQIQFAESSMYLHIQDRSEPGVRIEPKVPDLLIYWLQLLLPCQKI